MSNNTHLCGEASKLPLGLMSNRFSTQKIFPKLLTSLLILLPTTAIPQTTYQAPKTEHNHPDLQGTWHSGSFTFLERPGFFSSLVVTEEQAQEFAQVMLNRMADFGDPDTVLQGVSDLSTVRGERRSSVIVNPENGKIPFSEEGLALAEWDDDRVANEFDGPEGRNRDERCIGSLGIPPFRPFFVDIPRAILQTEDYVMIYTEDPVGSRIITLDGAHHVTYPRSYKGKSLGRWEEETLVIETSHFRAEDPALLAVGTTLLVGEDTTIEERLTRIAENELLYEFTVSDPNYYTEDWSGEYSFQRGDDHTYEYSCHEGNYSMAGILLGGRMEQEREAANTDEAASPQ